ncbi:SDR family NAD(P)-dependent oxidoreductase [Aerococcus sanguinicola]|uniref:2-hydroxypropyl-CoM dehydrogenase n=1 Tax=Aerococcus sanguinicola TaxID=119206 RepID=A0A0X8FBA2_9LACT|nr:MULTISPECIES: glucose 1-dehydrogenase [Aerococcus]AMB94187.1 2-hydroxypropyl-CoM dehydrogenase [Aerococcus sanguinicola]MDK7050037.1 glucose 1-dehydrogenase [Aerococcus sanguinicola]OFT92428.1 2-hydroxypropyl-CoM dehydrogenase [Aerococcus sp. HMSC23C02]PKZ22362.1 3-oxoacyl-ACP reductase [Aerococcus sanguinicola]
MALKNKVVLISGAASGMGKGEALAFAEAGAKVVIADLDKEKADQVVAEIQENKGTALAVETDITSTEAIAKLYQQVKESFGTVDVLVNNAGVFDQYQPLLDMDKDNWNFYLQINLTSVYEMTRTFLPDMIEKGGGKVINVASIAGLVAGKGGAAYTAAKHGVIGLTKHTASEYAAKGIQCNAIAPGTIETPLIAEVKDQIPTDNIPADRFGQVEEVANLVLFLASDKSNFINGVTLPIDGGYTIQ